MRAHVIENGIVAMTIMVEGLNSMPGLHLVDAALGGSLGDAYNEATGEFTPAPPPAPKVPQEVSRRRGLEALFKMYGLKDTDIEAAIVQNVTDPAAQYIALTEFKASQTFERNRDLVVFMGVALALDLDALFTMADALP